MITSSEIKEYLSINNINREDLTDSEKKEIANSLNEIKYKKYKKLCNAFYQKYKKHINYIPSDSEHQILMEYFSYHPRILIKSGCGIKHFKMLKTDKSVALHIIRLDNTIEPISCYFDRVVDKRKIVVKTLRDSIDYIVKSYRQSLNFNNYYCPLSNIRLYNDTHTHIDHYDLTFGEMVELFFKTYNIDVDTAFSYITKKTSNIVYTITNTKFLNTFVDFHNNHCKLRAIHSSVNLKLDCIKLINIK